MGWVWRGNWWPKNLHMHQRKGFVVFIWLLGGTCEWVWWWVDDMLYGDLKWLWWILVNFWSVRGKKQLLEIEFFWKWLRQIVIYFDLQLSSSYNGLSNVFVGHAPFFKSLTHLTHKHQKSLSQKAAQLLVCNCKEGSIGNWIFGLITYWIRSYLLLDAASSTQQNSTHTPSHILLHTTTLSIHHTHNYKQHQQLHYIITAPVDSTITASILASSTTLPLHSLLAPTLLCSPLLLLLHTLHSTLHSQFR